VSSAPESACPDSADWRIPCRSLPSVGAGGAAGEAERTCAGVNRGPLLTHITVPPIPCCASRTARQSSVSNEPVDGLHGILALGPCYL